MENKSKYLDENAVKLNLDELELELKSIEGKFEFKVEGCNKLDDAIIDLEKFSRLTQSRYWQELLLYDLKCVRKIIFDTQDKFELLKNEIECEQTNLNLLKNYDFYMIIELGLTKIFSAVDRFSQFLNCAYKLGLIENGSGKKLVSLERVKNNIEKIDEEVFYVLNELCELKSYKELKSIRNATTHHYNPFNGSDFIVYIHQDDGCQLTNKWSKLEDVFGSEFREIVKIVSICTNLRDLYNFLERIVPNVVVDVNYYLDKDMCFIKQI